MNNTLRVGFAQVDISPAIGDPWWWGQVERILDPVYARVIYLEQAGGEKVILAMADHCGFDRVADRRARAAMSQATGVPVSHVRINASHNHSCPDASWAVTEMIAGIGEKHVSLEWIAACEPRLAKAAAAAQAQARPARVFAGSAEVPEVSANRAFTAPDGKRVWRFGAYPQAHPQHELCRNGAIGQIDPLAGILCFRDLNDKPIVTLVNFACHVTTQPGRAKEVGADYPGYLARQVEAATGAPVFFLQGAGGNVGTGRYADGSFEMTQELARRIVDPVLRAYPKLAEVQTAPLRLVAWTEHVELHSGLPTAAELRQKLVPSPDTQWQIASMLNVVQDPLTRELDLFVLRAGDWCLAGLPGESMVESAIALRAASPFPHTIVGAYFDCSLWYIPTFERLRTADFESCGDWNYTTPGTSEQITAAMIGHLRQS